MRTVVVGIDGSDTSMSALDLAAEEAAAHLAPLVIVYAHPAGTGRVTAEEWLLDMAVSRVLADHPWLSVSSRVVDGEPCQALLAEARHALLLVVGHRCAASATVPAAMSASVPAAVSASVPAAVPVDLRAADGSECPVIVHRPVDAGRILDGPRPVLVGIDGHPGSDAVVEFAFDEAALRGAPVLGVHVWSGPAPARTSASAPVSASASRANGSPWPDEAARVLDKALDIWSAEYPEVPTVRRVAASSDVADALARASLGAQLAVIGSGGQHGAARPDARWTARSMVDHAGCPVAVVPRVA